MLFGWTAPKIFKTQNHIACKRANRKWLNVYFLWLPVPLSFNANVHRRSSWICHYPRSGCAQFPVWLKCPLRCLRSTDAPIRIFGANPDHQFFLTGLANINFFKKKKMFTFCYYSTGTFCLFFGMVLPIPNWRLYL